MDAITNGTSQAAQDEVLGGGGPVVASSSQVALSPQNIREVIGGDLGKVARAAAATRVNPEPEIYADTPVAAPYPATGSTTSPLHLQSSFGAAPGMVPQSYPSMPHINPAFAGSPPLSASAYSPYEQSPGGMGFQNPYSNYMMNPAQQPGASNPQWAWKYMQSPGSATNPVWNHSQAPGQPPLQPHTADAQRHRGPGADTEQLTAYLRNLAVNTPR